MGALLSNFRKRITALRKIRVRTLVGEILVLQLLFATLVGVSAIAGLWWTSSWVVSDNLQRWAIQWVSELDDLGVPLYTSQDQQKFLQIESYISKFPEIDFVRYYSKDGEIIFSEQTTTYRRSKEAPMLTTAQIATLSASTELEAPQIVDAGGLDSAPLRVGESVRNYFLDTSNVGDSLMRISAPVWVESMSSDGLLNLSDASAPVKRDIIGYVEVGLDFGIYKQQLTRNIITGSLVITAALLLFALIGRFIFRRALRPLSNLEKPLTELARGNMELSMPRSGHKEIDTIVDTLQSTVDSLKERDQKLHRLASRDALTDLVNRRYFMDALREELRRVPQGRTGALLFLGLDQFKYVNDTLGHAAGDRVIVQVADQLRMELGDDAVVSRFGGDEFTILLRDLDHHAATGVADGLLQVMRTHPFVEKGRLFHIHCSIGLTMIDSDRYTAEELLARADMACNQAKARGRNRMEQHIPGSGEAKQMASDMNWSERIKTALRHDRFVLHYQPIVDTRTGEPAHYEVLIRMQGESEELIPPDAFLPAANRFGLIADIDRWAIAGAMKAKAKHTAKHIHDCLTINLSAKTIDDSGLVGWVHDHLAKYELRPESIIFEITEQVAVENISIANNQIDALRVLGCKFAIDDFGTGYSSFSYIKDLSADYIKIDGCFVRDLVENEIDQLIVSSIAQIGKVANKFTIAEQVADAETFDLLEEFGIDFAQGFYIGKPSPRISRRTVPIRIDAARRRRRRAGR